MVECNNESDVYDYIIKLVEESKKANLQGGKFSLLKDIYEQLPFFVCRDNLLNVEYQEDIARYLYCKETGVAPYKGDYGQQPKLWIQKYYIIKSAIDLRNTMLQERQKNK